jgi:hypothetical protein
MELVRQPREAPRHSDLVRLLSPTESSSPAHSANNFRNRHITCTGVPIVTRWSIRNTQVTSRLSTLVAKISVSRAQEEQKYDIFFFREECGTWKLKMSSISFDWYLLKQARNRKLSLPPRPSQCKRLFF